MTLPLRLYHPRPLPYHHLLKFLVEDLTPHPCMKIARYIGIINVITAFYSVCQIREDKTYLKLSTSRLKLVLSFSAISSLLSICSLALLSLSRSRSISAFSLRDCSRSCSTANKSYLRKTEKLSVMKIRMLLENVQVLNFLIVPQLLLVLF